MKNKIEDLDNYHELKLTLEQIKRIIDHMWGHKKNDAGVVFEPLPAGSFQVIYACWFCRESYMNYCEVGEELLFVNKLESTRRYKKEHKAELSVMKLNNGKLTCTICDCSCIALVDPKEKVSDEFWFCINGCKK